MGICNLIRSSRLSTYTDYFTLRRTTKACREVLAPERPTLYHIWQVAKSPDTCKARTLGYLPLHLAGTSIGYQLHEVYIIERNHLPLTLNIGRIFSGANCQIERSNQDPNIPGAVLHAYLAI